MITYLLFYSLLLGILGSFGVVFSSGYIARKNAAVGTFAESASMMLLCVGLQCFFLLLAIGGLLADSSPRDKALCTFNLFLWLGAISVCLRLSLRDTREAWQNLGVA